MAQDNVFKKDEIAIMRLPREALSRFRAILVSLFFIVAASCLIVVLKNDLVNKKIFEIKESVLDFIGEHGFDLKDVVVIGRQKTTLEDLERVLNLKRGDNLLKINTQFLKQKLEQLPWVRDVYIRRSFFPNSVKIKISEKEVFALWQFNERLYPLDYDGYVIEADYQPKKPLLLVVGNGATDHVGSLLKVVKNVDESYFSRIKAVNFISGRRFNVILDDIKEGITVKLPEEGMEEAWKKLIYLDKVKGILKRKLTIIDLRLKDKVTVKLRKTKASSRKKEQNL